MFRSLSILLLFILFGCSSENSANERINSKKDTLSKAAIIRTNFSNEFEWKAICNKIKTPSKEHSFIAYVQRINDRKYNGVTTEKLLTSLPLNYQQTFVFIFDSVSVNNKQHPLLCVELFEKQHRSFYIKASDLWIADNNLATANMDFEEFVNNVDSNNIYIGLSK